MIILLKYADKLIIIMQYFKYMFEKQIYVCIPLKLAKLISWQKFCTVLNLARCKTKE